MCCFTGKEAIGTRGTARAYPAERGLSILTTAGGHLARSYERGPWEISAHHLAEGDAPALGGQPLTHLLSSLGSNATADGTLQGEVCTGHMERQPTTQPTATSPLGQEGLYVRLPVPGRQRLLLFISLLFNSGIRGTQCYMSFRGTTERLDESIRYSVLTTASAVPCRHHTMFSWYH